MTIFGSSFIPPISLHGESDRWNGLKCCIEQPEEIGTHDVKVKQGDIIGLTARSTCRHVSGLS